jgi:hypothetical protein
MSETWSGVTLEDIRERLSVAKVHIDESRLEMVRILIGDAIAPLHQGDVAIPREIEPALTFEIRA